MFGICTILKEIVISKINIVKQTNTLDIFSNCQSLNKVKINQYKHFPYLNNIFNFFNLLFILLIIPKFIFNFSIRQPFKSKKR